MRWLVVARLGRYGERAQCFLVCRMKRSGAHGRDSRWIPGLRHRIDSHDEPRGSTSGERILGNQASDDRDQPSSAVIERDDASGFRGLRRRAIIRSAARRAAEGERPAIVTESAHGSSSCSLGTSCNYKLEGLQDVGLPSSVKIRSRLHDGHPPKRTPRRPPRRFLGA